MVTQFFLTDALGSVLASFSDTPNSATVLGNQVYGPYGNQRYLKGTMGTAKGYTGQYADPTGLDYYNARYYDPVAGVFLSADTVQGNQQGMDPYNYVGGNPETHNDPTGHCWPWCTAVAGFIVGFVGSVISNVVSGQPIDWGGALKTGLGGAVVGFVGGLLLPVLTGSSVIVAGITSQLITGSVWGDIIGTALVGGSFLGVVGGLFEGAFGSLTPQPVKAPGPAKPTQQMPRIPTQPTPTQQMPQIPTQPTPTRPNYNIGGPTSRGGLNTPTTFGGTYYTVSLGDTLWGIASRFYGSGSLWQRIYQANVGVIGRNPNLIYRGERLLIPR